MEELIGTIVNEVYLSEDQKALMFDTNKGQLSFELLGESKVAAVTNIRKSSTFSDSEVISVTEVDWDYEECDGNAFETYSVRVLLKNGSTLTVMYVLQHEGIPSLLPPLYFVQMDSLEDINFKNI
jgi:hypothetical protein